MRFILLIIALCVLGACSKDEMSSKYSRKYPVNCGFVIAEHRELQPAVGGFGIFATIRQVGSEIHMECEEVVSTPNYTMNALQRDFLFGLGGLIVGNDYDGTLHCFDLACPNCDQAQYRLTVDGDHVNCAHCGIVYSLVHEGAIMDRGKDLHTKPRGLYQYQIRYDGMMIHMYN